LASKKWIWKETAEVVGVLSIVGSLILVAYEINQTRAGLEVSASADATDNFTQSVYAIAHDPEFSELMYRAEERYGELEDFERWRITKYFDGFFVMAQQDYFVIRAVDQATLVAYEFDWRERMALPVYREYWQQRRARYHPDYRAFLDRVIGELEVD